MYFTGLLPSRYLRTLRNYVLLIYAPHLLTSWMQTGHRGSCYESTTILLPAVCGRAGAGLLKKGTLVKRTTKTKSRLGGPRNGKAKSPGSPKTVRTVRRMARRILAAGEEQTRIAAARRLGLQPWDIKNLQAGNLPGLVLVLRLIKRGRYDPEALILQNKLQKLPPNTPVHKATHKLITERVRQLAKSDVAAVLAKSTGLSIYSIYQQRVANTRAGLHTVLGFIDAGVPPSHIFFGTRYPTARAEWLRLLVRTAHWVRRAYRRT